MFDVSMGQILLKYSLNAWGFFHFKMCDISVPLYTIVKVPVCIFTQFCSLKTQSK